MRTRWCLALFVALEAGCAPSPAPRPAPAPLTVPVEAEPVAPEAVTTGEPDYAAPNVRGDDAARGPAFPGSLSDIPCETVDDCWSDRDGNPIARPRQLRGKKFRPCEDGGGEPKCFEHRCGTVQYGC